MSKSEPRQKRLFEIDFCVPAVPARQQLAAPFIGLRSVANRREHEKFRRPSCGGPACQTRPIRDCAQKIPAASSKLPLFTLLAAKKIAN
jgi:hypothetical protein